MYAFTDTDRQDLFQEIVIQCWKSFSKFGGLSKFSTWLYRVAINTAISGLRKQKPVYVEYDAGAFSQKAVDVPTEDDQLNQLYTAVSRLNEIEKAIVMLYLEDKSYEEMEEVLGITQATLRVKMNRIKEKLRQLTKNK